MLSVTPGTTKVGCRPCRLSGVYTRVNTQARGLCTQQSARATSTLASVGDNGPKERILRYPDGYERRIVYPERVVADEDYSDSLTILGPDSDIDVYSLFYWDEGECSLVGAACLPLPAENALATPVVSPPALGEAEAAIVSWEQEFSALLSVAQDIENKVLGSYQVLFGSPWLLSRPLFVLALQQRLTGQPIMYSMQTRVEAEGAQEELAKVLKTPGLASKLSYSRLKDGVVAFETAEDAARFATFLEADMDGEVEVMEVDSHRLFQSVGDVDGLVVHLPAAGFLPQPIQLGNSLRAGSTGQDA